MVAIQPKWNFPIWSSFAPPKLHSPTSTSCCWKRWQNDDFHGVLALLIIQKLMKFFSPTGACINYHEKPKNIKFSSSKCPNHKRARQRATRMAEKPVLRPKFSKMTKTSSNSLKFGVKTLHHVSCLANEASAKIRSGSGLFRRFSALLNLLFRIFIFALQTCMRAQ